jgi:hypothetical protein
MQLYFKLNNSNEHFIILRNVYLFIAWNLIIRDILTLLLFQLDEAGLYVTELKDHVIIQETEDQIYNEEGIVLNIPAEEAVGGEVDLVVERRVNNEYLGNSS